MKNIVYVLLIFILTNKCFGIEYAYGSEDSGFFTREQSGWILGIGLGFANVVYNDYVIDTLAINTDKPRIKKYRIIIMRESRKTIAGSLRYIYNFEWNKL